MFYCAFAFPIPLIKHVLPFASYPVAVQQYVDILLCSDSEHTDKIYVSKLIMQRVFIRTRYLTLFHKPNR